MTTFLAAMALMATPTNPLPAGETWLSVAGIQAATFRLDEGTVTVYAPRDLMGGDRFSGSAFCEPAGASDADRARNLEALKGYRVSLLGTEANANQGAFTANIPSDAMKVEVMVSHADGSGAVRSEFGLMAGSFAPREFMHAPVINQGGALFVAGPFDGDRRTTMGMIDGSRAFVITESPRAATFSTGMGRLGRHSLSVREGAMDTHEGNFNEVRASIGSKGMRVGKTQMEVIVEGLDGVEASVFPLTVQLINETPQRVEFIPATDLTQQVSLTAAMVTGGVATVKVPVKAVRRGEFRMSSFVVGSGFVERLMR